MTTKAPAKVKEADPDSPTKKIYTMVEEFKDVIPVTNDRVRLAFCLVKYYNNEAATIKEAVFSAKPESCTIELKVLAKLAKEKYNKLGLK